MLVTVNNRLKFEIEIVHNLLCHPIVSSRAPSSSSDSILFIGFSVVLTDGSTCQCWDKCVL